MRQRRETPSPRRRLPRPLRSLVRIVTAALILALALVFLPHLTRWAGRLWPDPVRTERAGIVLRHELNQSARLETLTVDDEGSMTSTVQAALIGEVQRVTIQYDYHASIGVDLEKAEVTAENGVLNLILPPLEILSDSLTPTQVDRQDFWYPLTEKRRSQLLEEERASRASAVLQEARTSESLRRETVSRLEKLVASWLGAETWLVSVQISLPAEPSASLP